MKESKAREIAKALVMAELGSDMVQAPRVEKCAVPISVADEVTACCKYDYHFSLSSIYYHYAATGGASEEAQRIADQSYLQ